MASLCVGLWAGQASVEAAEPAPANAERGRGRSEVPVLTPAQWVQVDRAVDRGLEFIARNQQPDGSFAAPQVGQPGISSLCVMAFLARGHTPGQGTYRVQIERAMDFVLSTQSSNGLLSSPGGRPHYNHAIAGLMLGEIYGMTTGPRNEQIHAAISQALRYSRSRQLERKRHPHDQGGWRYLRPYPPNGSDLTLTSWHLMFYRSAKNAEFDVPAEWINEAMEYVRRCFDREQQSFVYALEKSFAEEYYVNGATAGCGIVSLAMAGEHDTDMARMAGEWILRNPFDHYNRRRQRDDRYHYSAFYCSQAMFLLGGKYWDEFFPTLLRTLVENQRGDGSWDRENRGDGPFGNVYTTALVVLSLSPPYQLLPIYQR